MPTPRTTPQADHPVNDFDFQPLGSVLQPCIRKAVAECGLATVRKGTKLPPIFVIWVVLMLTLRRDLNSHHLLNWMLSGFRWGEGCLPAVSQLISDGALTHARERVGLPVFQAIFRNLHGQHPALQPDFHGRVTGVFDGSTGTMPDTAQNRSTWGKPGSSREPAAFPQIRFMCLLVVATRTIWDLAYAPYRGKQTGERALMQTIVGRLGGVVLLLLLDAGLYSFDMVRLLRQKGHDVIVKVPKTVTLPVLKRFSDGSFRTTVRDSVEVASDSDAPTTRRQWRMETLSLRAMRVQIPGYRPWRLVTTLMDLAIPAREIARHYHTRWDIEIAYDEIKTHQCATLRGQSPTTFRSKRGDFVVQELSAMVISYTAIRLLMAHAAQTTGADPRELSFLETLHHLLEAAPLLTLHDEARQEIALGYLLSVIVTAHIDRPRRHRVAPRVIKVDRSRFPRKRETDVVVIRDMQNDLKILEGEGQETS